MADKNLRTKFAQVMKDCHYIQKTGINNFHGYNYVTSADVLDKVNTALLAYGIISTVQPTLLDFREVVTAKGNADKHATVKVDITLHDTTSTDTLTLSGIGSGQDSGDKAVMKAETAAIKYAYMLSLCIATGDDPEADDSVDESTQSQTMATKTTKENPKEKSTVAAAGHGSHCAECHAPITEKVESYSLSRFGHALCMRCQKHAQQSA